MRKRFESDEEKLKLERRRAKNRKLAQESRDRKKRRLDDLQQTVSELTELTLGLTHENEEMRQEVAALRCLALLHPLNSQLNPFQTGNK